MFRFLIGVMCSMAPRSTPNKNVSQGSIKSFCKRSDGKYVRLFGSYGLYYNSTILHKSSQRRYANECPQLFSYKTLFTKPDGGPDLACRLSFFDD